MNLRKLNLMVLATLTQMAMAEELPSVQLPAMTIYLDDKAPNTTYVYNNHQTIKRLVMRLRASQAYIAVVLVHMQVRLSYAVCLAIVSMS